MVSIHPWIGTRVCPFLCLSVFAYMTQKPKSDLGDILTEGGIHFDYDLVTKNDGLGSDSQGVCIYSLSKS